MLSYYFGKTEVIRETFGEIWRIQIQMYPQTSIEPRYGAYNLKNKVSANGLGLLVQTRRGSPVDDRPSTDKLHHFVRKKKN